MLAPLALLLVLGATAAPSPTVKRQQTRYTIKWAGAPSLFFEFDEIFTTPIYTPTPIKNGIEPYV